MIDTNTNKLMWVAMAVGLIAILGLGVMTIFPDALSTTQTQITKITKSFNDKTKDISNTDASSTDGTDKTSIDGEQSQNKNSNIDENTNNRNTNSSSTSKETTKKVGNYTVTTDSTGYDSYSIDNSIANFNYTKLADGTISIRGGGINYHKLIIPDYLIINNVKYKVTYLWNGAYGSSTIHYWTVPDKYDLYPLYYIRLPKDLQFDGDKFVAEHAFNSSLTGATTIEMSKKFILNDILSNYVSDIKYYD